MSAAQVQGKRVDEVLSAEAAEAVLESDRQAIDGRRGIAFEAIGLFGSGRRNFMNFKFPLLMRRGWRAGCSASAPTSPSAHAALQPGSSSTRCAQARSRSPRRFRAVREAYRAQPRRRRAPDDLRALARARRLARRRRTTAGL